MPLSKIQIDVLRLLASHRDPESYVAGAKPLNRAAPRYSNDIDVFHDREERVAAAALNDAETLAAAGYRVSWLRQLPLTYTAKVTQRGGSTRLEWVVDSDYRFSRPCRGHNLVRGEVNRMQDIPESLEKCAFLLTS